MLAEVFQPFVEKSPVSVLARAAMERLFSAPWINEVFDRTEGRHYTRSLAFSALFDLMVSVVFKHARSVRRAYLPKASEIAVSLTSVYNKLNGIPPAVPAELVRESARASCAVIESIGGRRAPDLPGYRTRIVDGNCLAATQHRIAETRALRAGVLPGKSLVVYDPEFGCAIDIVPCEDGHAQERSLFAPLLAMVERGDLWIADRNFCTRGLLFGIAHDAGADFIVREHKKLPVVEVGPRKKVGKTPTGRVEEQDAELVSQDGKKVLRIRRITIHLKGQTRDGDRELHVLTSLPKRILATKVANLYRGRWRIETAFQKLERDLNSEINTLGYPRAALFGFCVALVALNIMALVYAALRAVHGEKKIDEEFSHYYLGLELAETHRGMMIAVPEEHWTVFAQMSDQKFAAHILKLAKLVDLKSFPKTKRGPKKPPPKKKYRKQEPHVSTAKLLAERKAKSFR